MFSSILTLWRAPKLNPVNRKARSIPILNPFNTYGRVFTFSWLGFMLSFWAWYTFPPLLTTTIKKDLHLSSTEIANSNIISLVSTLIVRLFIGPLCDRFGPRYVFVSLMFLGCLPIGLAPLVKTVTGLYASRFFIGILGATFVPCQVWCTAFFDKNIVGTANALAGGWGNAGGGITYFIMPAVFDSLVAGDRGLSESTAWRLTFIVPLACLLLCGASMLFLCPDSPFGSWDTHAERIREHVRAHRVVGATVFNVSGDIEMVPATGSSSEIENQFFDAEGTVTKIEALMILKGETIANLNCKGIMRVIFSPQTLFHTSTYFCSFGAELAINSILGSYLVEHFPNMDQTKASHYAAVFCFLNFVTRPFGGIIGDILYSRCSRNLWLKKLWIILCGAISGSMLITLGTVFQKEQNKHDVGLFMGMLVVMAVFMEAANGANFALVPHVHPFANGIVSGLTGSAGNLGGIIFAIIFRVTSQYSSYHWGMIAIGIIQLVVNLGVICIQPLPKGQVGGT
ncbi:Nitrate transporter [Cladobotryum mycophilum]|uniref:Nitrate/nitrite transporter n=1 Tax=Cladobotryum mycophilum TaxID=491253 RepID=A0ABR0SFE9_9HYPO